MLFITNNTIQKVRQMDIDKLKKLKIAILCARIFVTLFTPVCMGVMSILVGLEIVNRNLYMLVLIIGIIILFFGLMLVDDLNFLIKYELIQRELRIKDETDKED